MTDDDFQRLRDSGMHDDEILDVAMLAAYTNFLTTWTEVPDVMPNQAR